MLGFHLMSIWFPVFNLDIVKNKSVKNFTSDRRLGINQQIFVHKYCISSEKLPKQDKDGICCFNWTLKALLVALGVFSEPWAACDVNDVTLLVRLELSPSTWAGRPNTALALTQTTLRPALSILSGRFLREHTAKEAYHSLMFLCQALHWTSACNQRCGLFDPVHARMAFLNNSNGITAIIFQESDILRVSSPNPLTEWKGGAHWERDTRGESVL